jgi:hypothetical protein
LKGEDMEKNSLEILRQFSKFIKKIVDEEVTKGNIQKLGIRQQYFRWRVEGFEYSPDKGVSVASARGEFFTKKEWIFEHNVVESIMQSNEYKTVLAELYKVFKGEGLNHKIEQLLRKMVDSYLYEHKIDEILLEVFLRELRGEPIKIGAVVQLQGVTLEPDSIQIAHGVRLRRPTITDIEKEIPIYAIDYALLYPSAILELQILGHSAIEIQKQVEKAISILRLFKVGGVKYVSYRMFSEGVISFIGGTITSLEKTQPLEFYPILKSDVPRLEKFWKEMMVSLPEEFVGFSSLTGKGYITFAYQRYCDALLSNGFLERRIANAIMGLEALYLNTPQELGRYLGLRISKFLGMAGWNPRKIMNVLKDAYRIRSIFVHGNRLNYKERKKFDNKYGSINKLLQELLEYLRISIILVLFLKKEKDELIDLIDNALIDRERENALSNEVDEIKRRLEISQSS